MTKRELVPTTIRTEFGEVLDSPEFYDTMGAALDHTYVAGYSNLRRERDAAIARELKEHDGNSSKINWKNVPTLPVRLQWARTTKVIGGQPDNTKEVDFGSQGYRFANKSDIGQPWLKEMPQGATTTADGSIKKGDTTLMVCDAKTAARNAASNRKAVERMHKDTVDSTMRAKGAAEFTYESAPADHQISAPPSRVK